MCVSCGCDQPDQDYGDARNIVRHQIEMAAAAASAAQNKKVSVQQIAKNITKAAGKAPKA